MLALLSLIGASLATDTRDALREAYKDDPQSALHLVVVDTGGTSLELLDEIRAGVAALAVELPPGDRLGVITFSDKVTPLLAPTEITESGRAELVARVAALPLAPGSATDLGAALAGVRDVLRQPGGPAISVVLVVSDFCHEPAPDSPYGFAGTEGCRQVRGLKELESSFDALPGRPLLIPLALTLGRPDPDGQGAVSRVLGQGRAVALREDQPLAWVDTYAENLPWRKIEALVEREVEAFELTGEVARVEEDKVVLELRSGLTRVGVGLDSLRFSDPTLVPVKGKAELTPNAEVVLEVRPPEAPFALLPSTRTLVIVGELTATATLEPRAALSRLGVSPGRGVTRIPLSVTYEQRYGPPIWALPLTALVAIGASLTGWRRARRED